MTTDKNKVSEPLVTDEWIEEQGDVMSKSIVEFGGTPEQGDQDAETWMGAARCVRYMYEAELSRLRQERDEAILLGTEFRDELVANESGAGSSNADRIRMLNAWEAILSKHKPQ